MFKLIRPYFFYRILILIVTTGFLLLPTLQIFIIYSAENDPSINSNIPLDIIPRQSPATSDISESDLGIILDTSIIIESKITAFTNFSVIPDLPYGYIRTDDILSLNITPFANVTVFNWDLGSNQSTVPPAPSITAVSEVHSLYYYLRDNATGDWGSGNVNITIDNTAVRVTLDNPAEGKITGYETLTFGYTPAFTGITWSWNGGSEISTPTVVFPDIAGIPIEGSHLLSLKITDAASRTIEHQFAFFIDHTSPPIALSSLTNNTQLPSGTVIEFNNATGNLTTDDIISFTFNWDSGSNFTDNMPILPTPNGIHTLEVWVTDEISNSDSAYYQFDASVGITDLTPDVSGQPSQTISISFTEAPDFQNYTKTYNNGTLIATNLSSPGDLSAEEGYFTLDIWVNDTGGHILALSYNISIDGTPVNYLSTIPANGSSFLQGVTQNITLSFDETPDQTIYQWNLTGTNFTTIPEIPNQTGVFTLTTWFTDIALNWRNVSLEFFRNLTLMINASDSDTLDPLELLTISTSSPAPQMFAQWDGSGFGSISNESLLTPPDSGFHTLDLEVRSNLTSTLLSHTYLIRIKVSYPDNLQVDYQSGTPVNLTFSETPALWSYTWDIESTSPYTFNKMPTLPTVDGNHTLFIKSANAVDPVEFKTNVVYSTDDTPPVFTLSNTANNSILVNNLAIQYTVSSDTIINQFWWDNDTGSAASVIPTRPTTDGFHLLHIMLVDDAGNIFQAKYVFEIDLTAPVITASPVNSSTITPDAQINITIDEVVNTSASMYSLNNQTFATGLQSITITNSLGVMGYGNHTFDIDLYVEDFQGNGKNYTLTYTMVDPVIRLTSNISLHTHLNTNEKLLKFGFSELVKNFTWIWGDANGNITVRHRIDQPSSISIPSPLEEGDFNLTILVRGNDGVIIEYFFEYTLDITAPTFGLLNVPIRINATAIQLQNFGVDQHNIQDVSAQQFVQVSIIDANLQDWQINVTYANGTMLQFSTGTFLPLSVSTPLADENVTISVSASDQGNLSASYFYVLYTTESPVAPDLPVFEILAVIGLGGTGAAVIGGALLYRRRGP